MVSPLTEPLIATAVNNLPIQGRIMLRLLLLQYLDVAREDIEYMTADRPDPRLQAGVKPTITTPSKDAIEGVSNRVAQYRMRSRQRRERSGLQVECLQGLLRASGALSGTAERLLKTRYGMDDAALSELRSQARVMVPKPMIRELDQKWERNEVSEDDYLKRRLAIEYQTDLRRIERDRKRLGVATREHRLVSSQPLQDHELGHVWGIPASSLTARKVKFLHLYLQGLQQELQKSVSDGGHSLPPIDLWKETFVVLSARPVERSVAGYDGLEHTEAALLEKLHALASRAMSEDLEARFWSSLVPSLFGLQRLAVIQGEQPTAPEAVEAALLARTSPAPKTTADATDEESTKVPPDLGEMGEHVLRSFLGEERR